MWTEGAVWRATSCGWPSSGLKTRCPSGWAKPIPTAWALPPAGDHGGSRGVGRSRPTRRRSPPAPGARPAAQIQPKREPQGPFPATHAALPRRFSANDSRETGSQSRPTLSCLQPRPLGQNLSASCGYRRLPQVRLPQVRPPQVWAAAPACRGPGGGCTCPAPSPRPPSFQLFPPL